MGSFLLTPYKLGCGKSWYWIWDTDGHNKGNMEIVDPEIPRYKYIDDITMTEMCGRVSSYIYSTNL